MKHYLLAFVIDEGVPPTGAAPTAFALANALQQSLEDWFDPDDADDWKLVEIRWDETLVRDLEGRVCGELLYAGDQIVAACAQPWGVEHPHSDYPVEEAVAHGLAAWLPDGEHPATVLILNRELAQTNITHLPPSEPQEDPT